MKETYVWRQMPSSFVGAVIKIQMLEFAFSKHSVHSLSRDII